MSTTTNLFQQASRKQLRFESGQGFLTTEDLWQMSLPSLDAIALKIDARLKEATGSFLKTVDVKKTAARAADELRLEILKVVIETIQSEADAKKAAAARRGQLAFLEGLREQQQLKKLGETPIEELDKQIAALKDADKE